MKTIGITGGVGSGKTQVLSFIRENFRCKVLMADEVAHMVKEKGTSCYTQLVELLGERVLDVDGNIQKERMAEKIFSDQYLLQRVNEIIHPAVKEYIVMEMEAERNRKELDFFFVEAALLIEDHYDEILDELWYIYADEQLRKQRLKKSRCYSGEKIDSIMKKQLPDEVYRKHCRVVIDNSGTLEDTYRQIQQKLGEYLS